MREQKSLLYKVKIIIVFILFLFFSVFGEVIVNHENLLDTTLVALRQKNKSTIEYFRKSHIGLLTEKEKLLHTINFSCAPSLDIGSNGKSTDGLTLGGSGANISTVIKGSCEINNWSIYFDVDALKYGYGNIGGIMIPVLSSKKNKSLILDTLISIEQKKSYYQIENLFLQDLKGIWGLVNGIQQIEDEIAIRKQVDKQIDSIGIFLSNFSKTGLINKRSMHLFKLTFLENKMQISILEKRVTLLIGQLQNQYFLENSQVNQVIEENKHFLFGIKNVFDKPIVANKVRTIVECIDSLNLCEIDKKRKYDTYNDFSMKIGPSISTPGSLREFSLGAGAQFTLNFIAKKSSYTENVNQVGSTALDYRNTISAMDSSTIIELNQYITSIEEEIGNIIEELKSGIQYSLPSLNDLYSKIISARTNSMNLRYSFFSYRINTIYSLDEIGQRCQLITILSGSE